MAFTALMDTPAITEAPAERRSSAPLTTVIGLAIVAVGLVKTNSETFGASVL